MKIMKTSFDGLRGAYNPVLPYILLMVSTHNHPHTIATATVVIALLLGDWRQRVFLIILQLLLLLMMLMMMIVGGTIGRVVQLIIPILPRCRFLGRR